MSASQRPLERAVTSEPLAQQLRDLKLAFIAERHEDLAKAAAHK